MYSMTLEYARFQMYRWLQEDKFNILILFKMIFKFYPEALKILDEEDVNKSLVRVAKICLQAYLGVPSYEDQNRQLSAIASKLTFKHYFRFITYKKAIAFLSFCLLVIQVQAQPLVALEPFYGGTALIQDDLTKSSLDAETGQIFGLDGTICFDVPLYFTASTGRNSNSFNFHPSIKGVFVEVGAGAYINEGPFQFNVGVSVRNTYFNGLVLRQWMVSTKAYYKNFFVKFQAGPYAYQDIASFGGAVAIGYRIPIVRLSKQVEETIIPSPQYYIPQNNKLISSF